MWSKRAASPADSGHWPLRVTKRAWLLLAVELLLVVVLLPVAALRESVPWPAVRVLAGDSSPELPEVCSWPPLLQLRLLVHY